MIKILQQTDEKYRDLPLEVHQRWDDERQIEQIFSCFSEQEGGVWLRIMSFQNTK